MEDEKIIALMKGYQAGTLSGEEALAFFQWYSEASLEEFNRLFSRYHLLPASLPVNPDMPDNFRMQLEQAIREHDAHMQEREEPESPVVPLFRRYRWGWAAAILIIIGVSGYLWYQSRQRDASETVQIPQPSVNDVAPGTTKAVLTLDDGRQVTIDSTQSGQLAVQGKTIVQQEKGAITYHDDKQGKTQTALYNTLTTHRGEQSPPLILSDGTKVWLNALSSIRFPVVFTGNSRNVEITGEAYFEVARNATMPFHVQVKAMQVEVLGTQFNVNAYDDEPAIKTTLLEGSVKVTHGGSAILKPGQQAVVASGSSTSGPSSSIQVQTANTEQAIAWKNGLFDFNRASLQTVLSQLARWYDIEVKFEGNIPAQTFRGKITRDLNLSQVIQVLQEVNVKFRLEGKTLIVTSPK